jgi:hypothetical protein
MRGLLSKYSLRRDVEAMAAFAVQVGALGAEERVRSLPTVVLPTGEWL